MSINRIPPLQHNDDLERPPITHPNLVLTACPRGFLIFQWTWRGITFYQERYHVNTYRRDGSTIAQEPIEE